MRIPPDHYLAQMAVPKLSQSLDKGDQKLSNQLEPCSFRVKLSITVYSTGNHSI